MKKLTIIISVLAVVLLSGCDKTGKKGQLVCTLKSEGDAQVVTLEHDGKTVTQVNSVITMDFDDDFTASIMLDLFQNMYAPTKDIKGFSVTVKATSDKMSVIIEAAVDLKNIDAEAYEEFFDTFVGSEDTVVFFSKGNNDLTSYQARLEANDFSCK